jgi:hypothetical protein
LPPAPKTSGTIRWCPATAITVPGERTAYFFAFSPSSTRRRKRNRQRGSAAASVHDSSPIRCRGNVDKRCKNAAREQGRGGFGPALTGLQPATSSRRVFGFDGCGDLLLLTFRLLRLRCDRSFRRLRCTIDFRNGQSRPCGNVRSTRSGPPALRKFGETFGMRFSDRACIGRSGRI